MGIERFESYEREMLNQGETGVQSKDSWDLKQYKLPGTQDFDV